jgi:hypothetical protein
MLAGSDRPAIGLVEISVLGTTPSAVASRKYDPQQLPVLSNKLPLYMARVIRVSEFADTERTANTTNAGWTVTPSLASPSRN